MQFPFFRADADPEASSGWYIVPSEAVPSRERTFLQTLREDALVRRVVRALGRAVVAVLLVAGLITFVSFELRSSWLQAHLFSHWAEGMTVRVEAGPSPSVHFPTHGPHDARLGYTALPAHIDTLAGDGFVIDAQARWSGGLEAVRAWGLYPPYDEKDQAGLRIVDRAGTSIFEAAYPRHVYADVDSIPSLVWKSLLFIENRELVDPEQPMKNPAIEWDRFAAAVAMHLLQGDGPGGSTLATQLAKVRHSPYGLTHSAVEKLRQMGSASLQAYRDGPDTQDERWEIIKIYLNSLPLAAAPGHGEVNSLGDGLRVWYGADPPQVNALLRDLEAGDPAAVVDPAMLGPHAVAYRQVLSLLLSTRSPTRYLVREGGDDALAALTDRYLGLLHEAGVVGPALYEAARSATVEVRRSAPAPAPPPFEQRKASTAVRADLLRRLGVTHLAALDRYDLTAHTTYDRDAQAAAARLLERLHDPAFLRANHLYGERLHGEADPQEVTYSVVLYERTDAGNALRVQVDNYPGPFDVNRGSKLELGSTAKLRTLVTYLEVIEEVYDVFAGAAPEQLRAIPIAENDALTRWTLETLAERPSISKADLLEAAMRRTYPADPDERFFTGGAVHVFSNFDPETDGDWSVHAALQHSVNLVFVRMMRDVVNYHVARLPGQPASMLERPDDERRAEYLRRFADREGRALVARHYRRYREAARSGRLLDALGARHEGRSVRRLSYAYRAVFPEGQREAFTRFMRRYGRNGERLSEAWARRHYRRAHPERFTWQDRGYLAGIHPLELWVAKALFVNPEVPLAEVIRESETVRQEVYAWLQRKGTSTQDPRIRILLEQEAFGRIHERWARLGYPFDELVPTYATALGVSADRPSALSELVSILMRDGLRAPTLHLSALHFGAGTPYETRLGRRLPDPRRVLSPELCRVVRAAMTDVVSRGTAIRARGSITGPDGTPIPVGGKTGTGDNRRTVPGADGTEHETVLNRTSTFSFFVGDRFFGTVVAFVDGPEAADYTFTSSLPAAVFRLLGPTIEDLWTRTDAQPSAPGGAREHGWAEAGSTGRPDGPAAARSDAREEGFARTERGEGAT
jgi:membrane peptidoglycan carboxypeptidase